MPLKLNTKIRSGVISIKNIPETFSDGTHIPKGELNSSDYAPTGDVSTCARFPFTLSANSNPREFDFTDLVLVCSKLIYLKI